MASITHTSEMANFSEVTPVDLEDVEICRQEEMELLEAIYINELSIGKDENGQINRISILLHPATGENAQLQYVCVTLDFSLPPQYPFVRPDISMRNPRGLSDEHLSELRQSLHELSEARKGNPMLYELIEHVKESLTQSNVPHGFCIICLESFEQGQEFTKTDCYHYFHSTCLLRYIQHSLRDMEHQQQEQQQHQHLHQKSSKGVMCPICREAISYNKQAVENVTPDDPKPQLPPLSKDVRAMQCQMAELFIKQKAKGGIIDLEAEKNKYLVTPDTVLIIPSESSSPATVSQPEVPVDDGASEIQAKKHNRRRMKKNTRSGTDAPGTSVTAEERSDTGSAPQQTDAEKPAVDPEVARRRMMNQRRHHNSQQSRNQLSKKDTRQLASESGTSHEPAQDGEVGPKSDVAETGQEKETDASVENNTSKEDDRKEPESREHASGRHRNDKKGDWWHGEHHDNRHDNYNYRSGYQRGRRNWSKNYNDNPRRPPRLSQTNPRENENGCAEVGHYDHSQGNEREKMAHKEKESHQYESQTTDEGKADNSTGGERPRHYGRDYPQQSYRRPWKNRSNAYKDGERTQELEQTSEASVTHSAGQRGRQGYRDDRSRSHRHDGYYDYRRPNDYRNHGGYKSNSYNHYQDSDNYDVTNGYGNSEPSFRAPLRSFQRRPPPGYAQRSPYVEAAGGEDHR